MPKLKKEEGLPVVNPGLLVKLQERDIAISQLNRFIVDLRKELVLSRFNNNAAVRELRLLSQQLAEKVNELDSLRSYISRKEESEHLLQNEFGQQMASKDREIQGLKHLFEKRCGLYEKQLQMLRSQLKEGAAVPKEDATKEFMLQLKKKDRELHELKLRSRQDSDEKALMLLRQKLVNKELQHDQMYRELSSRLKERDNEISWLRQNLVSREKKNRDADSALSRQLTEKDEGLEYLRQQLIDNEASNKKIVHELQQQLEAKERKVEQLKSFMTGKKELQNRALMLLRQQLAEKEEQFEQAAQEYEDRESKNLKFLQEGEKLREKLEQKDILNKKLQSRMVLFEEQNNLLQGQLEQTRSRKQPKLDIKAVIEAGNKKHEERIKEIIRQYTEKEIARKAEIEQLNARILEQKQLLAEKQDRIDQALTEFALKTEQLLSLKEGAAGISFTGRETKLLEEKGKELAEKEKRINELLKEATTHITEAKEKEAGIARREEEISVKESLLLREQEALQREFDVLEKAGFELKRSKEYLVEKKEELEGVSSRIEREKRAPPAEIPAAPVGLREQLRIPELTPPEKPSVKSPPSLKTLEEKEQGAVKAIEATEEPRTPSLKVEQVKPVAVKLGKGKAELLRPARPVKEEKQKLVKEAKRIFSGEREGYSDVDEITSIIEIATAHGDSKERIKKSLLGSGYREADVEKAFNSLG